LEAHRLKPADGQQPMALLRMCRRSWLGEFPLYDPVQAAQMRPLSAKQQAAVEARRTCPKWNEVRRYVAYRVCTGCARSTR
jgi:hypothetical protein